ncbi:MAG: hypothetical protein ACON4L_00105 [Flavobacteriaceae bacterium]
MAESRARSLANLANTSALSVDSSSLDVGISSASPDSDLNVGASIKMDGPSGIITATAFSGDGTNLTNVGVDTATVNTGALKVSGISTLTGVVNAGSDVRVTGNLNAGITTLGAVTVTSITGDGSGLTGVANTDFVVSTATTTARLTVNNDANIIGVSTFTGTTTLGQVTLGIGKSINFDNVQKAFIQEHAVGLGTTTTAGRDAGVGTAKGAIIFNSTTNFVQVYNGISWDNMSNKFDASGGTKVTPGNGYAYHVFTSPGNFIVNPGPSGNIDILVVAGGGGGGGGGITCSMIGISSSNSSSIFNFPISISDLS